MDELNNYWQGRGPGNTKTEDILNYNDNYQITKKFLATKSFLKISKIL